MAPYVNIINLILYYSWLCAEYIFNAFGLSWLGVVVGLAVISAILRLFAANLIGSAMAIPQSKPTASAQQRIERKNFRRSAGRRVSNSPRAANDCSK